MKTCFFESYNFVGTFTSSGYVIGLDLRGMNYNFLRNAMLSVLIEVCFIEFQLNNGCDIPVGL